MEVEAANVASVSITVQILMLVFTFIVGHLLRRRKIMVVHEAGAALLIGVLVGLVVRVSGEERGFKYTSSFIPSTNTTHYNSLQHYQACYHSLSIS